MSKKIGILIDRKKWNRWLEKIVKRRSDGKLYEASYPDNYNEGQAIADALSGKHHFYLREIVRLPKKWWQKTPRYKRTGEIWEPSEGNEFDVIQEREG